MNLTELDQLIDAIRTLNDVITSLEELDRIVEDPNIQVAIRKIDSAASMLDQLGSED
jgi:hypothetical protein